MSVILIYLIIGIIIGEVSVLSIIKKIPDYKFKYSVIETISIFAFLWLPIIMMVLIENVKK